MNAVIVGKDVSKDIKGKYLKYNADTFLEDISNYKVVVYVGEDASLLKRIAVDTRTANKSFVYIGKCDPDYVLRKVKGSKVYKTVSECPKVIVKTPIVETPEVTIVESNINESTEVLDDATTTSGESLVSRLFQ